MRRLTFEGYLLAEVQRLAGVQTTALAVLCNRLPEEPRLFEPLAMWAAVTGSLSRFEACVQSESRAEELSKLRALSSSGNLENALSSEDLPLPPAYLKTWTSYVSRRDASKRDEMLKSAVRDRVLAAEAARHVTRYRMAKDLGLNHGNLHAFLSMGNTKKLSLDRAYELLKYVEAA